MVKYNKHVSIKVKVKLLKNKMHLRRVGWVEQRLYKKKKLALKRSKAYITDGSVSRKSWS